jgi:hypothetical protein
MKELRAAGKGILRSKPIAGLCRALGIDIRQYRLLLRLFGILSDRMEFLNVAFGLYRAAGYFVFFSLLISLIVFVRPPLPVYLALVIGISMFMTFMMVFVDVGNSLMNPDEASVLSWQPVRGATYVSAKLTRIVEVIVVIVSSLNAIPAVAGLYLYDAHWYYPLTHMMAAYLAGFFVGFLVCALYGWLFHFVSPANVKNAALWLQFSVMFLWMLSGSLVQVYGALFGVLGSVLKSPWMPWRWFASVGLLGHAKYPGYSAWESAAGCLLTIVFIAVGLRAFRADYMIKVSALLQGGAGGRTRPARRFRLMTLVRKVTGAPSGAGAFSWVWTMLRRDWTFRMYGLFYILGFGLLMLAAALVSIRISPFAAGKFAAIHFFPHAIGFILAITCKLMPYTAQPGGSAIFAALPFGSLRPFLRGIFASLWIPALVMHLFLMGPCMFFWGVAEGFLFTAFSMALVSFYVSMTIFFIDGFPFTGAFMPWVAKSLNAVYLGMLVPILVIGGIQWLCFRSAFLVVAATIILAALAYATAHFSLAKLESRIRVNLKMLGFGPSAMFKQLE